MAQTSALPGSTVLTSALETVKYNTLVHLSTTVPGQREITLSEVSWHDSITDCWIVVYDRVYDITDFLNEHPGGSDVLLEYAGRDASVAFRGAGHSQEALLALTRFMIGELPIDERIFRKPDGYKLSGIPD